MRAFCYLRVSTRDQLDGYSLAAQERALRDYCAAHGWDAPTLWTDAGRSGYTDSTEQRPQFAAMLHAAEAGGCDVILVHKLDRFARSLITTLRELRRLERAGVGFISLAEQMDFSTPIGRVILSVLAAFAEYFSANLSRETKKGLAERAAAGYRHATIPYAARLATDGKALEVDPDRAEGLALLLALVAGESYIAAARALNTRGVPPRRATIWHGATVRAVVEHAGWLADQPEPWPARYHAAATRIGKASVRTGRATRMLTGLLRCGHCGRTIGYQPRDPHPPCTGPGKHLAPHYETIVAAWIASLPDEAYLAERAAHQDTDADPVFALAAALRDEGQRLGLAWADGLLSRDTYEARKADLAARERSLPPAHTHSSRWRTELLLLRNLFTTLPAAAQNGALRGIIAHVTIIGYDAQITPRPEVATLLSRV